jgi:HD-like signal output (HDOD) protein
MTVDGVGPVKVEAHVNKDNEQSNAEYMKNIRKKKLEREMFADPSVAKKLVQAEASPVYNARGEILQSVNVHTGS